MNVFELALFLAAFASAGWVAKYFHTDSLVVYGLAIFFAFIVYFIPTIAFVIKDRGKRR